MKLFTSDPHIGHKKLAQVRGMSVEEHDATIFDGINRTAGRNDTLYILGDLGSGVARLRLAVKCRDIRVIQGNHDLSLSRLGRIFGHDKVSQLKFVRHSGAIIHLSHYPHAYWHKSHRQSIHLYGHVHAQREAKLDEVFPARRSMDVGVDNALRLLGEMRPFTIDEVMHLLAHRSGHDIIQDIIAEGNPQY